MRKLIYSLFGLCTITILLIGALTPGWLVFITNDAHVHSGLFYVVVSGSGYHVTVGHNVGDTGGMLEFQLEICVGLVLAIASVIVTFIYSKDKTPSMLIAPIVMYLLAGILTWVAVGRWINVVTFVGHFLDVIVPYSLIFSGLGGIFCFVLMVLLLLMYVEHKRRQDENMNVFAVSNQQYKGPFDKA